MKLFFIVLLLFPSIILAQNSEGDTLKLKADLSITGFLQGGNVQTVIFRAKSEVNYRPCKKWQFKTRNSYVYQEFGRTKADEDILSLNFLYFNPDKKVFPLLLGFVSSNFRREISLRSLLGAGVSVNALKTESSFLKLSITSEYEQTDFNEVNFNLTEYDGNDEINTLRGTVWVNGRYELFSKKLIITHESYFQPSFEESNNYRWQADVGLETPISKHLNFKINYLNTFESIVVEGQDEEDRFLTFGLTVKSY